MNAPAQRSARWLWAGASGAALAAVLLLLPADVIHSLQEALVHPAGKTSSPRMYSRRAGPPGVNPPARPVLSPRPPTPSSEPVGTPVAQASEPSDQAPQSQWLPVATGFAHDFADPGSSHQDWMARTSRWTTASLAALGDVVDPGVVPAATVTAVEPTGVGEDVVDVVATYDTGLRLLYRLENSPTGWKVTTVVSADS